MANAQGVRFEMSRAILSICGRAPRHPSFTMVYDQSPMTQTLQRDKSPITTSKLCNITRPTPERFIYVCEYVTQRNRDAVSSQSNSPPSRPSCELIISLLNRVLQPP